MDIREFIRLLFSNEVANFVILLLILLPAAQWVTGVLRAYASHSLKWDLVDAFVRSDIAGRVLPLIGFIVLARIIEVAAPKTLTVAGLDLSPLGTGAALSASAVYLAIVAGRIVANVNPSAPDTLPKPE